jgi:CHAT domain-containing protein
VLDEIDIHLVTNTKDLLQFKKKKTTGQQAELFGRPAYQLDASEHLAVVQASRQSAVEMSWLSDQERAKRRSATFSDLPGTEKEVKDVGQLLKRNHRQANVHLGKDALEEAVKAVDNPAILHIATHGFCAIR